MIEDDRYFEELIELEDEFYFEEYTKELREQVLKIIEEYDNLGSISSKKIVKNKKRNFKDNMI